MFEVSQELVRGGLRDRMSPEVSRGIRFAWPFLRRDELLFVVIDLVHDLTFVLRL